MRSKGWRLAGPLSDVTPPCAECRRRLNTHPRAPAENAPPAAGAAGCPGGLGAWLVRDASEPGGGRWSRWSSGPRSVGCISWRGSRSRSPAIATRSGGRCVRRGRRAMSGAAAVEAGSLPGGDPSAAARGRRAARPGDPERTGTQPSIAQLTLLMRGQRLALPTYRRKRHEPPPSRSTGRATRRENETRWMTAAVELWCCSPRSPSPPSRAPEPRRPWPPPACPHCHPGYAAGSPPCVRVVATALACAPAVVLAVTDQAPTPPARHPDNHAAIAAFPTARPAAAHGNHAGPAASAAAPRPSRAAGPRSRARRDATLRIAPPQKEPNAHETHQ